MAKSNAPALVVSRRVAQRLAALSCALFLLVFLCLAFWWAADDPLANVERLRMLETAGIWTQAALLILAAFVAYRQWRTFGSVSRKRITFDFIAKIQMDRDVLEAIAVKRKAFADAEGASADGRADRAEWLARLFSEENSDRVQKTFCTPEAVHIHFQNNRQTVSVDGDTVSETMDSISSDINQSVDQMGASSTSIILTPRNAITTLLNVYEIIAIGISRGALDEEMMALWWQTTIVKDYFQLHKAIAYSRARGGNQRLFENFQQLAMRWYDRLPEHERPAE